MTEGNGWLKRIRSNAEKSSRPVGSLRPDSGLHPVGIDNPFNAFDFRQPSLIQNPQAGCLASTFDKRNEIQP